MRIFIDPQKIKSIFYVKTPSTYMLLAIAIDAAGGEMLF